MSESSTQTKPLFRRQKLFYVRVLLSLLVYALAAFFLFHNLSDRLLWGDEAETAMLGRNILKFGVPKVYDGKNLLTQYPEPWEANEDGIWTWNTWLPYYAAAGSFKIFGENTFSARLPFALFGLLAVILMRKFARDFYADEETALIAAVLLVLSVPFLVHARQARYFSMLAFGTMWLLIGYNQLVFERKKMGGVHAAFALTFLFYSSFIGFVGNAVGVGLHYLVMMKKKRASLRDALPCGILTSALILPWVLYSGMLAKGGSTRLSGSIHALSYYISRMNFHLFPLILLLLPPLALFLRRVPVREWVPSEKTLLLVVVIAGNLASLSIFPFLYFRYLITVAPVLYLLQARILREFVAVRPMRYLLLFLLVATNIPGIVSLYPYRGTRTIGSPILEFVRGITSPYEDKFENVLAFLRTNAQEGESLAMMDPGYPLMFYMKMKIIDARYPRNQDDIWKADWVLSESPGGVIDYGPAGILRPPETVAQSYRPHKLLVRDTPLGASRPDPDLYQPLTAHGFKPLIIYQRIKQGAGREGTPGTL